jgi:protein MpaA
MGQPLLAYTFGFASESTANPRKKVLLLGGVHGDEIEGVVMVNGLLQEFLKSYPYSLQTILVPAVNPDGVLLKTRCNYAGVDLNRNLPTKDWTAEVLNPRYTPGPAAGSEPENQALLQLINKFAPDLIVSFHSWKPMVNFNGPSRDFAQIIHDHTGYEITSDMGYPTPGSLGTYAGAERKIPTVTYEIEHGQQPDTIFAFHYTGVRETLKALELR